VHFAEFVDCRFADDPHVLLGYQNGNHCARGFDHTPIADRHPNQRERQWGARPPGRVDRHVQVRMEAKRRALDEIASRQRAADEKRKAEAERQQAAAVVTQSVVTQ